MGFEPTAFSSTGSRSDQLELRRQEVKRKGWGSNPQGSRSTPFASLSNRVSRLRLQTSQLVSNERNEPEGFASTQCWTRTNDPLFVRQVLYAI